jgi:hypothetical protein
MIRNAFDALVLIIGTLSIAAASALLITPLLTKYWTRRWLRVRLRPTSDKSTAITPTTTPHATSAPLAITDFLDAVARDVRSGFSLAASFVQCSDRQLETVDSLNRWWVFAAGSYGW